MLFHTAMFGWLGPVAVLVLASGCGTSPGDEASELDGSARGATADGSAATDATLDGVTTDGSVAVDANASPPCSSDECVLPAGLEAEMTWSTVNVGRSYETRAQVAAVIDRVGDDLEPRAGPSFIGWQEIGAADPCGSCEIELIRSRFTTGAGWRTMRPRGLRPDGNRERVNVPVTSRGAHERPLGVRAVYASSAWAGVSSTRFVTVVYYPERNLSVLNTHFIAGAWSCRSEPERRRRYWRRAWQTLTEEVAREHDAGRNVIVTGDLNRPRLENHCNPAWDPTSLHERARIIGGRGIDYVFAVPAASWRFRSSRRPDGSVERGAIPLGIDGHQGHWVRGRFRYGE